MMINYNFVDGVAIEVESLDHRLQLLDLASFTNAKINQTKLRKKHSFY